MHCLQLEVVQRRPEAKMHSETGEAAKENTDSLERIELSRTLGGKNSSYCTPLRKAIRTFLSIAAYLARLFLRLLVPVNGKQY